VMSQKDVEETRKVNTHESSEENRYQLLQAMAAKNETTEQLSRVKMSKKQCKANLNYREQRHIPDEIKYGKYERKSGSQTGTSAGAGVDVAPVAPTRMGGGSKLK